MEIPINDFRSIVEMVDVGYVSDTEVGFRRTDYTIV